MSPFLKFSIGVAARVVGTVAEHFAQWIFHQISTGVESGLDFLTDLGEFGRWLVRTLAGQFCGRPAHQFDRYEEEYQPGYFRN